MRGACTPSRGVVCTDARDAHPGPQCVAACARGACTPSRGRRLYRPCGTPGPSLSGCVGPAPPFASVVRVDLAGRSFRFVACSHVSAWGLYPLARGRLYRPRDSHLGSQCVACARGAYTPSRGRVSRASSVPTPRDDLPAAVRARGACTPFRVICLYRSRGTLVQYHHPLPLAREGPVPPPAGIVSSYLAERHVPPLSECEGAVSLLQCRIYPLRGTLVQGYQLALLVHEGPAPSPAGRPISPTVRV